MDYSKSFKYTLRVAKIVLAILGLNILAPNFRPNWATGYTGLVCFLGYLWTIYSVYAFKDDFAGCLKVLCVSTEAFQGTCQMYAFIRHSRTLASLIEFITSVFNCNNKVGQHRAEPQIICGKHYKLGLKIASFCVICVIISTACTPLYSYMAVGEVGLFVENAHLPGYPPDTRTIITITMTIQLIMIITAMLGNFIFNVYLFTSIIHLSLLTGLFEASLKELDEEISDQVTKLEQIKERLRNIIIMHQDLVRYISTINDVLGPIFFALVSLNSFSIAINTFCILKTDWIGAYGYLSFSFVRLFMLCALGTYVDYQSDKTTDAIYSVNWYRLPIDCQRTIFLLLLRSQNSTKLTIANITLLNVATGAKIMKAIYSYLMVMLNMNE